MRRVVVTGMGIVSCIGTDLPSVLTSLQQGKSGIARDLNISKTGHLTITVVQANGERFKTLGKNVVVQAP